MPHDPDTSLIVERARKEPLAGPDVWAKAVLDVCEEQGYTPDMQLCGARSVSAALTMDRSPYPDAVRRYVRCQRFAVDTECGHASSSTEATQGVVLDGSANVAAATTVETPTLGMPPELLANAYRMDAPCLVKHSAASGAATANCQASPLCLAGLQTLRSTKSAVKECTDFCMGRGPTLLPLPFCAEAHHGDSGADKKRSDQQQQGEDSDNSKQPEAPLMDTIPDDFPCLWRGVRNMGNTCYFNAVIQLLFATPAVRRAILADGSQLAANDEQARTAATTTTADPTNGDNPDGPATADSSGVGVGSEYATATASQPIGGSDPSDLSPPSPAHPASAAAASLPEPTVLSQSGLKEVFAQMAFSRAGAGADPTSFAQYLSLDPALQQDAQEFLALLLDWLRCRCGPEIKRAVDTTFSGTLLYDRRCGACGRSAKRAEPFLHLSVPVKATLQESLADFLKPEHVGGFACEGCGQRVTATSHQYLRTLPDVLVLHLNRFQFDVRTLQLQKVLSTTSFPLTLDMTPYAAQWNQARKQEQQQQKGETHDVDRHDEGEGKEEMEFAPTTTDNSASHPEPAPQVYKYELRGVLSHLGDTATSGHYTYQGKVLHKAAEATLMGGAKGTTARGIVASCRATNSSSAAATKEADSEEIMTAEDEVATDKDVCWLDFNDAVVTRLNRFKGSGGLSKDAYVLVYHRLPVDDDDGNSVRDDKATDAASSDTAAVKAAAATRAAALHNPPPVPSEFPRYLLDYAARINRFAVEERATWEQRKRELRAILDKWAAAAAAVFDPARFARVDLAATMRTRARCGLASGSESVANSNSGSAADAVYVLPTAWLRFFGRGFMGAFVNVEAFGEDPATSAARKGAREESEPDSLTPGQLAILESSGAAASAGASASSTQRMPKNASAGVLTTDGHEESVPDSPLTEVGCSVSVDGSAYYQTVRQHGLVSFLSDIICPHGRLAPWGTYKLVNRRAFTLVQSFLAACENAGQSVGSANSEKSNTRPETGSTGDAAVPIGKIVGQYKAAFSFNVQQEHCTACAAAMAAGVYRLSLASCADAIALLGIHGVSAVTVANGCESGAESPRTPKAVSDDPTGIIVARTAAADDELVYIDEEVASNWEDYVGSKAAWQGVAKSEGYTGVFTLAQNQLPPPPSAQSSALTGGSGRGGGGATIQAGSGAAVINGAAMTPQQHLHLQKLATAMMIALEVSKEEQEQRRKQQQHPNKSGAESDSNRPRNHFANTEEENGLEAHRYQYEEDSDSDHDFFAGRRAPDMRAKLTCPHGELKPEANVRVVPESLRRYLLRRLPVVMARTGLLSPLHSSHAIAVPPLAIILPAATTNTNTATAESDAAAPTSAALLPALLERVLLPYLPSADLHKCQVCVHSTTKRLASQHQTKMARLAERKQFPTLWAAGRLTSPEVVAAALMASAGAESEEQMILTQHPNRVFFKRCADREYRERTRAWREQQAARMARQENAIADLRVRAQKQKESDAAWKAMIAGSKRRGGGGGQRLQQTLSSSDPRNPIRQLALAEEFLAMMKVEEPPAVEVAYGCLPTWWVARWYRHVSEHAGAPLSSALPAMGSGVQPGEDDLSSIAPARHHADIHGSNSADEARTHDLKNEDDLSTALANVSYKPFLCPHGKLLLEMSWLNPADGFWQGMRRKRAEALWNGDSSGCAGNYTGTTRSGAISGTACGNGEAHGPGRTSEGHTTFKPEDLRWSSWLPPLLVVPQDEFIAVLERYGTSEMLESASPPTDTINTTDTNGAATGDGTHGNGTGGQAGTRTSKQGPTGVTAATHCSQDVMAVQSKPQRFPSRTATIQLVERNGERHIVPDGCEVCARSIVDSFQDNCAYFTNGSLRLQLHLRKSKKLFYDANCVLNSETLAANAAAAAAANNNRTAADTQGVPAAAASSESVGLHHFTTLRQLRVLLSEYIMREHGFIVPADKLEILRGRKPLKRRHHTGAETAAAAVAASPSCGGRVDAGGMHRSPSPSAAAEPNTKNTATVASTGGSLVEDATLFEFGIHDGDTLNVSLIEAIAAPCAKAHCRETGRHDAEEEEWEAIPAELLIEGNTAGTTAKHAAAFGDTRLQGGGAGSGPLPVVTVGQQEDAGGVSCPVCTFLNAPGMVACEMCESPLPQPPPRRRG